MAIDDHSRTSLVTMVWDERQDSAVALPEQVVTHLPPVRRARAAGDDRQRIGLLVQGLCRRLPAAGRAPSAHVAVHAADQRKAERFFQTCLREWAYAASYATSQQRREALQDWLHPYDCHRPHSALGGQPPISRLPPSRNNLLKLHS